VTKIVITIEVEGGNVSVSTGGQRATTTASSDKPFVERPDPEYPDWDPVCHAHGVDWKLIAAGTSKKTGKRYNAFYVCPERDCDEKPEWKPKDDAVEDLGF
jgi:hypothetical protein